MQKKKKNKSKGELVVKPANIRIWIHDKDLGRLQQVVWEGHGDRLRMETSHHPLVRRFLNAVPYIMGLVKDVHNAAINNELLILKKHCQDPVPRDILKSKDSNGLTPLHKAAGLGNEDSVKELISRCPEVVNQQDKEGRTPLHWAAALKDNGHMFWVLKDAGALEDILDKRGKPPGFYQVRPKDLTDGEDINKILKEVPEAPRTASILPNSWDWKLLQTDYDSGSSAGYANPPSHSVNGDSAFEDMGMEDPPGEVSQQRFIEEERRNATPQPVAVVKPDDDFDDEGVGGEPEDSQKRVGNPGDDPPDSDREYAEVDPQFSAQNLINDADPNGPAIQRIERDPIDEPVSPLKRETLNQVNAGGDRGGVMNEGMDTSNESNDEERDRERERRRSRGGWHNITGRNRSPQHPLDSPRKPLGMYEQRRENSAGPVDKEVQEIVDGGDLERMAELVLGGQGDRLLRCRSTLPEVQMFIENVPTYMAKIKAVHAYTREGNLRGVQTALDRRKFAVSRERGGLTPLHEAVLYGRAAVLRYLAARFPETLHSRDLNGRTALHYAATLPDGAHFYNVLLTLGADKDAIDKYGKTPEHYLKNQGELTHSQLLAEFEKGIRSEFGTSYYGRIDDRELVESSVIQEGFPVFGAEDGQYLANSLGDPLIKGLTEVANVRPSQPIIYLANYLVSYSKINHDNNDNHINNSTTNLRANIRTPIKDSAATAIPSRHASPRPAQKNSDEIDDGRHFSDEENFFGNSEVKRDEKIDVENERDGYDEDDEDEGDDDDDGNDGSKVHSLVQERRPSEGSQSAFKQTDRDEHGQTMLHFAATRSHGRNGLFQLLQDMDCNIGLRDELYRTARDVAMQVNLPENVIAIDRYIVSLAAKGETNKLQELLLEGYDHILDAEDDQSIVEIAAKRSQHSTLAFLQTISTFEERRDRLHHAIRVGNSSQVQEMIRYGNGPQLATAKNLQSRCSLHIAVLGQFESIVEHIATRYPQTLHVGDNLMRMPLHYAMGVDKVEVLSRILIRAGAQRIVKDLKGRQPSYYFMNKSEIQILQDEEDSFKE